MEIDGKQMEIQNLLSTVEQQAEREEQLTSEHDALKQRATAPAYQSKSKILSSQEVSTKIAAFQESNLKLKESLADVRAVSLSSV